MTLQLDTTIIFVADMQRALDFYIRQLGLEAVSTSGHWSLLNAASQTKLALHYTTELRLGNADSPTLPPGQVQLTFRLNGIDALCASLHAQGVKITGPMDIPDIGLRVAYLRDPDGTALQLVEQI
jgi:predicted enzyme related to lactoylglutathione lyase